MGVPKGPKQQETPTCGPQAQQLPLLEMSPEAVRGWFVLWTLGWPPESCGVGQAPHGGLPSSRHGAKPGANSSLQNQRQDHSGEDFDANSPPSHVRLEDPELGMSCQSKHPGAESSSSAPGQGEASVLLPSPCPLLQLQCLLRGPWHLPHHTKHSQAPTSQSGQGSWREGTVVRTGAALE